MQNELDIVRDISQRLDGADISYMLTGSMAMNYYAQPRMTRDIDIVVALRSTDTERVALVRNKLMARSAEERFLMGVHMFDAARAMVLASLPAGLSRDEIRRQLFQRLYGQALPSSGGG
ncbi:MAG: hypothetical protein ABSH48_07170 [Verrucomicrobiota bacterium]|jgi:hypothetical protein